MTVVESFFVALHFDAAISNRSFVSPLGDMWARAAATSRTMMRSSAGLNLDRRPVPLRKPPLVVLPVLGALAGTGTTEPDGADPQIVEGGGKGVGTEFAVAEGTAGVGGEGAW